MSIRIFSSFYSRMRRVDRGLLKTLMWIWGVIITVGFCIFTIPGINISGLVVYAQSVEEQTTNFYVPLFQGDADNWLGAAISNGSNSPADFTSTAYDKDGNLVDFPNNPAQYTLQPHEQLAKLGWEIFGASADVSRNGWIHVQTNNPRTGVLAMYGNAGMTQLDGTAPTRYDAKKIYFTRVFEGDGVFNGQKATTELSVTNLYYTDIEVDFTLSTPTR